MTEVVWNIVKADRAQCTLFPINKDKICCIIKALTDWLKCAYRLVLMGVPQQNTADHITLSNVVWRLSPHEIILQAGAQHSPKISLLRLIHFSHHSLFITVISFYC